MYKRLTKSADELATLLYSGAIVDGVKFWKCLKYILFIDKHESTNFK